MALPKKELEPLEYKPTINDGFWYDIGKDLVSGLPEKINISAEKFEKLILWLWGIYTPLIGIGAGGLTLLQQNLPSMMVMFLLILPCIVLLFSYWLVVRAQTSVFVSFDPRSPTEIENKYSWIVYEKGKYFSLSRWVTLVACTLIPIAMLSHYFDRKQSSIAKPELIVTQKEKETDKIRIMILGSYTLHNPQDGIKLRVIADNRNLNIPNQLFLPPDNGSIREEIITIPETVRVIKVSVEWSETPEHKHIIFKELELKR